MQEHFPQSIFCPNIFCWILVLSYNIFLMNWISSSFNVSKFISSPSQVFGRIDVLEKLRQVHKKTPMLEYVLIKMHSSNLQSEILIKRLRERHRHRCVPVDFAKILRTLFLYNSLCNFNIAKVRLSIYFVFFSNPRYLPESLQNSINLVSLESFTIVLTGVL